MTTAETILQAAAQLPEPERLEIIQKLLETLEPPAESDLTEAAKAWQSELRRRSTQLRHSQAATIPWSRVQQEAKGFWMADTEVEFHVEARAEYLEALAWYFQRSEFVGRTFQSEVVRGIDLIEEQPL